MASVKWEVVVLNKNFRTLSTAITCLSKVKAAGIPISPRVPAGSARSFPSLLLIRPTYFFCPSPLSLSLSLSLSHPMSVACRRSESPLC